MSVILSDDFDGGPAAFAANWTPVSAGLTAVRGGCGFPQATGLAGKYFVSCTCACQSKRSFTATNTVSARFIYQFYHPSGGGFTISEPVFLQAPGIDAGCTFAFIIQFRSDGSLLVRTNAVSQSASSAGIFPTDGTAFAVQFRLQITSNNTYTYAVDINNSTVYSGSSSPEGFTICPAGWGNVFNRVDILGTGFVDPKISIDTLEIDNSNASTSWSVCSTIPKLWSFNPVAVPTAIAGTVGGNTLTITGTSFRQFLDSSQFPSGIVVQVRDPNNNIYAEVDYGQPNAPNAVVTYNSTTQLTMVLNSPLTIIDGEWCVFVGNLNYCWEQSAATSPLTCFQLNGGSPTPPNPCDPVTPPNFPYTLPSGVTTQSMNNTITES